MYRREVGPLREMQIWTIAEFCRGGEQCGLGIVLRYAASTEKGRHLPALEPVWDEVKSCAQELPVQLLC